MKYVLGFTAGAVLFLASASHAGLDWTTVHSRANCGNNESITWWYLHPYNWKVVSFHQFKQQPAHMMDTGFSYTWRQHAIHWGEGVHGDFQVWGYHYLYEYSQKVPFDTTYANDCSIYDGW